jgi:pSer/pThr/pTyr-binding forkhead associated (FHA) protein
MPPADVSYVLFIARADDLHALPLPPVGLLTVGRSRSSDVRLSDKLVSAHHAVLAVGSELSITDLDSRNGTRVGERVIPAFQPTTIRPGEQVCIGETVLTIDLGADRHALDPGTTSVDSQPDTLLSSPV